MLREPARDVAGPADIGQVAGFAEGAEDVDVSGHASSGVWRSNRRGSAQRGPAALERAGRNHRLRALQQAVVARGRRRRIGGAHFRRGRLVVLAGLLPAGAGAGACSPPPSARRARRPAAWHAARPAPRRCAPGRRVSAWRPFRYCCRARRPAGSAPARPAGLAPASRRTDCPAVRRSIRLLAAALRLPSACGAGCGIGTLAITTGWHWLGAGCARLGGHGRRIGRARQRAGRLRQCRRPG